MVPPTSVTLLPLWSMLASTCRAMSPSKRAPCLGSSGDVRIRKMPLPVGCTTPFTFSRSTAACTACTLGWPLNLTVNSLPPWKSMPSRKPLVTIEMMPGMMISSEIPKKTLRWLMMSSLRTLVALAWPWAAWSAVTSLGRLSSATGHPQDALRARPAEVEHDREQVVRDDDRRDQADRNADGQDDGKPAHRPRAGEDQDDAGDQRRGVGVPDRGPRPAHRGLDRRPDRAARAHLLLEALEDQHVGVH